MKKTVTIFCVIIFAACAATAKFAPTAEELPAMEAKVPGLTYDEAMQGYKLYAGNCSKCHRLHNPKEYTAVQWNKILPEMLKSFEFGGGGSKVFTIIISIAEKLSDEDFEKDIQPVIVRMFASQERGIRMCLLENLGKVIDRLNPKIVNDKIFPNIVFRIRSTNHFQ